MLHEEIAGLVKGPLLLEIRRDCDVVDDFEKGWVLGVQVRPMQEVFELSNINLIFSTV